MRIKQANISSFGKLKNIEFKFTDGLNIVCGNNEAGKSTLAAFIKLMLYGADSQKRTSLNPRIKYMPWEGGEISGSLVATGNDNRDYIIKRIIGKSKKTDECICKSLTDGAQVAYEPIDFIGLGEAAFERTVFMRQLGMAFDPSCGELTSRLNNMVQSGDETVSYTNATELLKKAKTAYTGYKAGELARLSAQHEAIDKEIEGIRRLLDQYSLSQNQRDDIELNIKELSKQIEEIQYEIENNKKAALYAEYNHACAKMAELSDCKEQAKSKIEAAQNRTNELKHFENEPNLEYLSDKDNANTENKKALTYIAACLAQMLLFILLGFFALPSLAFGAVLGLIGAIYFVLKLVKNKKKLLNNKENEHTVLEYMKGREAYLIAGKDYEAASDSYNRALKDYNNADSLVKQAAAAIETSYGRIEDSYIPIITEKSEVLEPELNKLKAQYMSTLLQRQTADTLAKQALSQGYRIIELQEERSRIEITIAKARQRAEAIGLAAELLETAYNNLREGYMPSLKQEAGKVIEKISKGEYKTITFDGEGTVSVALSYGSEFHQSDFLSVGAQDMAYFSLRFAIIRLIAGDNKYPLIIDDSFVSLDDTRKKAVIDIIAEYSKDNQVIFLTCHNEIKQQLLEVGGSIIEL